MNLVLFLLSFLFASYAPSAPVSNDGNPNGTGQAPNDGHGKGGKFRDGDYIIAMDVMP